jgi:signal transduction histidine kinase/FixJ family two-component response regulator
MLAINYGGSTMNKSLLYHNVETRLLNETIEIFASESLKKFEDVMDNCARLASEVFNLDRLTIYSKNKTDKNSFGQFYKWDKANGGTTSADKLLKSLPITSVLARWFDNVYVGECVIRRLDKMSKEEIDFAKKFDIKSVVIIPIFTNNEFWGAVSFRDNTNERDFDDCIDSLYSLAHLYASMAIREYEQQEKNETTSALEHSKRMLEVLNEAAIKFISQNEESVDARIEAGVRSICDAAKLDRFSIWRNFDKPDGLHASQVYRWDRNAGGTTEPMPELKDISYAKFAPHWETILANNNIINGPAKLMQEADKLQSFGVVSALIVPLFIKSTFWGFVLFEDRSEEHYFEKEQVEIMSSAAFLCANTLIQRQMEIDIAEKLEQQKIISDISKNFVSSDEANELINQALEKLGKNLNVSRMVIHILDYENSSTNVAYQWLSGDNVPKIRQRYDFDNFKIIKSAYPNILAENSQVPVVLCSNVASSDKFKELKSADIASFLALPLYIDGYLWGIVSAENCFAQSEWTEGDISFLAMASSVISSAITRDIYNARLKLALNKVTALNKAKDNFLAKVSHEIRTPMNAIMSIIGIQLQNESIPRKREALSIIQNSGHSLLRVINDLLDLSKIEAKKLEIIPVKYKIANLISNTVQLNDMYIENKPIKFKLSVDENIPDELFGDELRIKQILNNILSNAFKYTSQGEVLMSVSAEKSESEIFGITLVFRISDTGQGIAEEQKLNLFKEYYRFNSSGNRSIEGTGLGLAIVHNLANLMNGSVSVESELGKGTAFMVRLPQKIMGSGVLGREMSENLQNFRVINSPQIKNVQMEYEPMPYGSILIVDDVQSNLYVAKKLLEPYNLSIEVVNSGFDAIDKIKSGKVYDIIFMDHMMPKMDGMEATKIIRKSGYLHPIIALTANALVGQAEIFLKNGFDGFISKPINTIQLDAELHKFIRNKQPAKTVAEKTNYAETSTEALCK